MAETIVVLSGDDAQLLAAIKRVIAQERQMVDGFKGVEGASKKSTDSAVKDAERFERESKKAADAMFREHKKLMDSKELASRTAGQKEEAIARQTAFAETKAAIAAADKEIKEAERILSAKKKLAVEEAKVAANGSLESMKNMVGTVTSLAGAAGVAAKAFQLLKTAKDSALGSLEGLAPSNQKLAQIAESGKDLADMQSRADAAAMATGVPRAQARDVLFNAKSEGFDKSYEAMMAASPVVDPSAQAKVAGKLTAMFKGQIGPMESVSLALKAANESNLDFPQMANTLAIAGEGASVLGASPEETAAIAATLSARFKSGDVAADRMKGFGSKAGIDPRFAGSGFMGAYDKIKALPEDERKDFLGENQELNTFYVAITEDMAKIKDQLTKLTKERKEFAGGRGELRSKLKNTERDPSFSALKNVNISRVRNEIATEQNLAKSAANDEIASKNAMTKVEEKNGSMLNRFATASASFGLNLLADGIAPETKANLASGFGDLIHKKPLHGPVDGRRRAPPDWLNELRKSPELGKQSIEESFKADAGKGPANNIATNLGLIKSLEDERAKLKPKITELQDKEQITDAEKVQIRDAQFHVTKAKSLASSLGDRKDIKAEGIRLDVEKAESRLNLVKAKATLTPRESEELQATQAKDTQFAERIESLRRQDAEKLQKTTEKTNDLLTQQNKLIESLFPPQTTTPSPNAIRAQTEQSRHD